MSNLNLYIPGRPTYIYRNGICYRKTDERTYDSGTIYDESDIDRTSNSKTEHQQTGKAIWIQQSCEECSTPGGIQMISVDWVSSSIMIGADIHSLTNPNLGTAFFTVEPLRTRNYVKNQDDGDGDGVDDSIIGPGLIASITMDRGASFHEVFGAITPVKIGVNPPEAGFVDPLSAAFGFYQIEDDTIASVYMQSGMEDIVILPGHPDYDYATVPLEIFRVTSAYEWTGGVMASVTVTSQFGSMFPGEEYDPRPTDPCIHPVLGAPAFYAFPQRAEGSPRVEASILMTATSSYEITNGSNDRNEGGAGKHVAVADRWKKLKTGGDPDNLDDWEGEEGQYNSGTSGARFFSVIASPAPDTSEDWNDLP